MLSRYQAACAIASFCTFTTLTQLKVYKTDIFSELSSPELSSLSLNPPHIDTSRSHTKSETVDQNKLTGKSRNPAVITTKSSEPNGLTVTPLEVTNRPVRQIESMRKPSVPDEITVKTSKQNDFVGKSAKVSSSIVRTSSINGLAKNSADQTGSGGKAADSNHLAGMPAELTEKAADSSSRSNQSANQNLYRKTSEPVQPAVMYFNQSRSASTAEPKDSTSKPVNGSTGLIVLPASVSSIESRSASLPSLPRISDQSSISVKKTLPAKKKFGGFSMVENSPNRVFEFRENDEDNLKQKDDSFSKNQVCRKDFFLSIISFIT